jgi:hypothetical protein
VNLDFLSPFELIIETTVDAAGVGDKLTVGHAFATPEPSSWAMMLLGFAGLGFVGYHRTKVVRTAQSHKGWGIKSRMPARRIPASR